MPAVTQSWVEISMLTVPERMRVCCYERWYTFVISNHWKRAVSLSGNGKHGSKNLC